MNVYVLIWFLIGIVVGMTISAAIILKGTLADAKESVKELSNMSQELKSIGMNVDVMVQYIHAIESIIVSSGHGPLVQEWEKTRDDFIDRYGDVFKKGETK